MTDLRDTAPADWPLVINCLGIKCGACSTLILPKNRGRPLATDVLVIVATIEKHKPKCSVVLARQALDERTRRAP